MQRAGTRDMPKRLIDIRVGVPLLDIASYARRGPGHRDRLSTAEVQQIARTVRRTPEVMVKVLSRGGQDFGAVGRHLDYLRLRDDGELELETDDGRQLSGHGISKELLEDWDLDLEEHRRQSDLDARRTRSPKLVHKLMFSMPAGTQPKKVLAAVKSFAREEFALKHLIWPRSCRQDGGKRIACRCGMESMCWRRAVGWPGR